MFEAADTDGNGTLDLDEFLALCAAQPSIVSAFDAIVEAGLRLAEQREQMHLKSIFRQPLSPNSRCIRSPGSGLRSRPSLVHLRPIDELVVEHATSAKW